MSDSGVAGTGEAAPHMSSQMPLLVCFLGEREGECWPLGGKAAFKPHGFGETVKWGYQGSLNDLNFRSSAQVNQLVKRGGKIITL